MRLPDWIRTRHKPGAMRDVKSLLRRHGLSTVCEEARCPNKSECFSKPTATFMILGHACTRNCGFCSVSHEIPLPPDPDEPMRVADAAFEMGLKYVVLTSPTRDDLPDGGAGMFSLTIKEIRLRLPNAKVEVLTPDFGGSEEALKVALDARPDVFNHNVETVPRLYDIVRPQADYMRSLNVLRNAKRIAGDISTKSGLMVGLGETFDELISVFRDLRDSGCDFITIGQYLRPGRNNLEVKEYVEPSVFERLKDAAMDMGFKYAACFPLARSSMNAQEVFEHVNV